MKKIRIDTRIKYKDIDTTVGKLLFDLMEGVPAEDIKTGIKQIAIADELNKALEAKEEWFSFEEADQSYMETVLDKSSKFNSPRVLAPIKESIDSAIAFKGQEPVEDKDKADK